MAIKNLKNAGMPVPPQAAGIASQQGSPKKPQKPLHTGRKSKPGNAVQSSTTQPPTAQLPTFGSLKSMLEDPEFKKLSKARRGEEIASLRNLGWPHLG
ncbi:hypothetical protein ASPZODRAFT_383644 [Penicilliopsis zonata CBS 506.65]|uniref:Uncharacterized protein n=1 Tax=Penicilliopsis zonata CBS 506.65 TaxID=1073090 RepID=A0A1L9SW45_9EURO|nr:hypothetical protein ASPZODRAFT_383644 [Penicilliopsis zonata CBS 506.65]OJJ51422.1 hypothetical protein ASPZODRAFT_383644 [Penicilliopsis zonata CBS 506.65]